MIFVTVGTQPNGFLRCLQSVEELVDIYKIEEEIVAQIGYTQFSTDKFKCIDFIGENDFKKMIKGATLVITHAGSGAIFNSIKAGKKIIAMARLKEYHEMVDNHQTELISKLAKDGYLIDGTYSLIDAWQKVSGFIPRENDFKCDIVKELKKYIEKNIK